MGFPIQIAPKTMNVDVSPSELSLECAQNSLIRSQEYSRAGILNVIDKLNQSFLELKAREAEFQSESQLLRVRIAELEAQNLELSDSNEDSLKKSSFHIDELTKKIKGLSEDLAFQSAADLKRKEAVQAVHQMALMEYTDLVESLRKEIENEKAETDIQLRRMEGREKRLSHTQDEEVKAHNLEVQKLQDQIDILRNQPPPKLSDAEVDQLYREMRRRNRY